MGVTIIGETYAAEEAAAGKLKLVPLRGFRLRRESAWPCVRTTSCRKAPAL